MENIFDTILAEMKIEHPNREPFRFIASKPISTKHIRDGNLQIRSFADPNKFQINQAKIRAINRKNIWFSDGLFRFIKECFRCCLVINFCH